MAYAPFSTAYTPEPTRCSGGETSGARALQDWVCNESPWGAHLWDVGIYACRDVLGGWCPDCDHSRLSQHASGGALDSAHNIVDGGNPHARAFALWEVANHAVLGVQEVITNAERWTLALGWRDYHGVSLHRDHVHTALNASGRRYLTRARILSVAPQEDDLTPEQDARLKRIETHLDHLDPWPPERLSITGEKVATGGRMASRSLRWAAETVKKVRKL